MKNTIKIIGIIALVGIIGFSMVSCGSLESGLEGTWKKGEHSLTIAKDNFSYSISGVGSVKVGDSVKTKGDEIIIELSKVETAKVKYKLDGNKLTLSSASGAFSAVSDTINGEWTK
jgi:hypothetical protein